MPYIWLYYINHILYNVSSSSTGAQKAVFFTRLAIWLFCRWGSMRLDAEVFQRCVLSACACVWAASCPGGTTASPTPSVARHCVRTWRRALFGPPGLIAGTVSYGPISHAIVIILSFAPEPNLQNPSVISLTTVFSIFYCICLV